MVLSSFNLLVACLSLTAEFGNAIATPRCKCMPDDPCWPTPKQFEDFNATVSGKLIRDQPPAQVCYPGPFYNAKSCAYVNKNAENSVFLADTTVGLSYPVNRNSCPPVPQGQTPGNCSIGIAPRYTVNATCYQEVAAAIKFAKEHNLRLVIRNTGHDILGRSTGDGSLQIWIRYIRDGIRFQESYVPSDGCSQTAWKGSAITIGGGYVWSDVYKVSAAQKVIVVGGSDPSVGTIGGWMQGGGHSTATRNYGLGADQVLEAQVVLADGRLVTANACQNSDLFFAVRGGGPGTYGVVTSTTVKVYPETNVVAHSLAFAPLSNSSKNMDKFMTALADVYSAYPDLSDGGFSGYGSWSIASPTPLVANYTVGFSHTIAMFGSTMQRAKKVARPYLDKISIYNGTSLFVSTNFQRFASYNDYFVTDSDVQQKVGVSSALGSRLLDRQGLSGSRDALAKALKVVAGTPDQFTSNNIVFVGGGVVRKANPGSAILPAWRKAYVHNIVARGWAPDASDATIAAVHHDITYNKIGALRTLVPDSGAYMNEADRLDQYYASDFYGGNLKSLMALKKKYDPDSVFYCKTCVGSGSWVVHDGRLCRKRGGTA